MALSYETSKTNSKKDKLDQSRARGQKSVLLGSVKWTDTTKEQVVPQVHLPWLE
jgi:hypothetical protein